VCVCVCVCVCITSGYWLGVSPKPKIRSGSACWGNAEEGGK